MSKEMRDNIQELVNNYRTLTLVVKKDKEFIYHVEIYNKGVKLFVGKDEIFILSLSRALCAIIHFIENEKVNKYTELTAEEVNRILELVRELDIKRNTQFIDIFVPKGIEEFIG